MKRVIFFEHTHVLQVMSDPVAGLGLVSNTRKKVCDSPWPSRATELKFQSWGAEEGERASVQITE